MVRCEQEGPVRHPQPSPLDVVRHVLMDTLTLVADPRRVSDVAAVRALEVAYGIPPTGSVGAAGA